jgi:hypothetical protein
MERTLSYLLEGREGLCYLYEGLYDPRAQQALLLQLLDVKPYVDEGSSAIGSKISTTSSSKNLANTYSPLCLRP